MTYVDPQSDLVKAVLVKKATQLATDGLEQLLDGAESHGLSRDEALAIIDRTIGELRERDESGRLFSYFARPLKLRLKTATMANCSPVSQGRSEATLALALREVSGTRHDPRQRR